MKAKAVEEKVKNGRVGHTARTLVITAIIVVVVAAITGFAIYRDRVAPFRIPVVIVDDASVSMRYFLRRVRMSGEDPFDMLGTLTHELLIKQMAPKPPYSITVTEEDIDNYFRNAASSESDITDDEFEEWYRQQLNESKLSESDVRDIGRTAVTGRRLQELLAAEISTVAEHVYLHMILTDDRNIASQIKERKDAGETFAHLASEFSIDPRLKENGGDFGWVPRNALVPAITKTAFDELEIGEASDPLYLDQQTFAVVMISDRTQAMEIDEVYLNAIRSRALEEWLRNEEQLHEIEFNGLSEGYDAETDAWVRWQLTRMGS